MEDKKLIIHTTGELAEMWKTKNETIRRLIHNGNLKAFKVGRNWRIKEEDVKEYMKNTQAEE